MTQEELDRWVAQTNERLSKLTERHKAEWEYLQSDQYKEDVRRQIIGRTHADITPPWEE